MGRKIRFHWILAFIFTVSAAGIRADAPSDGLFKKAEEYFFQKKYEMAEKLLQQVAEAEKNPLAYSYLGDISLLHRQYQEAIRYYNLALQNSSKPGNEYFRLGQVYLELRKGDEALNNFLQAYNNDPTNKPSLYEIGYVYLMYKRDKHKTIEYWKRFLAEAPQDYQYEQIKKAIAMLEDEKCEIPAENSGISMEEVLLNCGHIIKPSEATTKDRKAGSEGIRTSNPKGDLIDDAPDGF